MIYQYDKCNRQYKPRNSPNNETLPYWSWTHVNECDSGFDET